jgi:hypothetical protein
MVAEPLATGEAKAGDGRKEYDVLVISASALFIQSELGGTL